MIRNEKNAFYCASAFASTVIILPITYFIANVMFKFKLSVLDILLPIIFCLIYKLIVNARTYSISKIINKYTFTKLDLNAQKELLAELEDKQIYENDCIFTKNLFVFYANYKLTFVDYENIKSFKFLSTNINKDKSTCDGKLQIKVNIGKKDKKIRMNYSLPFGEITNVLFECKKRNESIIF